MAPMLPAGFPATTSLADVLTSCLRAIVGETPSVPVPPVERAVVVLCDGLGALALRARAGHARTLSARLERASTIDSGSPTTTAAAIATLCTGRPPGEHGIVGYRALDPATGRVFNHLSGWGSEPDAVAWQPLPTVFEQAARHGIPSNAVGPGRYRSSSYSAAVLRGAEYVGANGIRERVRRVRELFDRGGRRLVYLYVPELDQTAHARGWESEAWLATLEEVDAAMGELARGLRDGEGAFVTADHGVLDVPEHRHVLYDRNLDLLRGVAHVAGDPRMLQLHLDASATEGDVQTLAEAWNAAEGHRSWIATRSQAIDAGWFGGRVDDAVRPRIGHVIVAARAGIAYYHSGLDDAHAQAMVGQHGSLTPEEQKVPLLRFGAFA